MQTSHKKVQDTKPLLSLRTHKNLECPSEIKYLAKIQIKSIYIKATDIHKDKQYSGDRELQSYIKR